MRPSRYIPESCLVLIVLLLAGAGSWAQEDTRSLILDNFDQLTRRVTDSGHVWYGYGNIKLRMEGTEIVSDSFVWYRDKNIIHFYGNVEAYDSVQHIWAQQVSYYHRDSLLVARHDVVLINTTDSVRTLSQRAKYYRNTEKVFLDSLPQLYLNYPDTANMVKITADFLTFHSDDKSAEADSNVIIVYQNTRATCQRAEYLHDLRQLILKDEPHAVQDSSYLDGDEMALFFSGQGIKQIDVLNNASALFVEEADSTGSGLAGQSVLSGDKISFYFKDDDIRKIAATGSAQSKYYPPEDDTTGTGKNFVSGDTIFIFVDSSHITKIDIIGGAEGVYITEKEGGEKPVVDTLAAAAEISFDTLTAALPPTDGVVVIRDDTTVVTPGDSTAVPDSVSQAGMVADSILYAGNYLEYFADKRILRITDNANVKQGQVELEADRVDYDIPNRVVYAQARVDTVDSNASPTPVMLRDGNDQIMGSRLVFNVDSKKGKIENATTQYEQAYYRGQDLYKEDEKVFYVCDGRLTSCDQEEPHFHFRTKNLKIINNEKAIARPVTLYIETLPVLIIPYYVFPLKKGRHSGILPIKLGNFEEGRRYIGNLGYYWAASDYWDIQSGLDFYENTAVTLNNYLRYKKRYDFDGYVNFSYTRENIEQATKTSKSNRWQINGSHRQMLPYDIDFAASGTFVSDNRYSLDFSADQDERLNRTLRSQANFNKKFGASSLTMTFLHTEELDTETRTSNLPSGSFSMPSFYPFGSGSTVDGKEVKKWYNSLLVGYNNRFGTSLSKERRVTRDTVLVDSLVYTILGDSLSADTLRVDTILVDSLVYDTSSTYREFGYINHHVSFSTPQTLFEYFSVTPSMSMSETWYYIMDTDLAREAGILTNRTYRRAAVSAGISSSTKLYGTFPINIGGLVGLRHVLSPSLGFSWSPAITKNDRVKDYTRVGDGSRYQSKRLNFSLGQLFSAKIKQGDQEKKYDFLNVSSSFSYNFEAETEKFSYLTTSLSSGVLPNIRLQGSLTHDFYDTHDKLRFLSPSLRSFSISTTYQAKGSVSDDYVRQGLDPSPDMDTTGFFPSPPGEGQAGLTQNEDRKEPGGPIEWNLNLSHYYTESRSFGTTTSRTHWVQFTFNMNITRKWKLKYSQKYDFVRHQSIDKIVDLYRQMHCWEGHFYWIPEGSRKGYYFKINVISIPDIKVERSESGLRGALFNR